ASAPEGSRQRAPPADEGYQSEEDAQRAHDQGDDRDDEGAAAERPDPFNPGCGVVGALGPAPVDERAVGVRLADVERVGLRPARTRVETEHGVLTRRDGTAGPAD